MIRILIDSEELDLPAGFSLSIEDTSPIFNDRGSQSISANVPATPKNKRLLGFPNRLDQKYGPSDRMPVCMVQSGAYIRSGKLNITGANSQSIELNIGFDNSLAYEEWKTKKLTDLGNLPVLEFESTQKLWDFFLRIYREADSKTDDLAVFDICLSREKYKEQSGNGEDRELTCLELLNAGLYDTSKIAPFSGAWTVKRVIDNELTTVSVPDGYGFTPFVRAWRLLEFIFDDLGLDMESNPLKENADLSRLVVLNNTADTLCAKKINYAELMPDCTVEDFLKALWVRFGLTFTTDFDRKTVTLKFIRDIMNERPAKDIEQYLTEEPETEYGQRKYLALSAGTTIEGAETLTERLEDFLKGFDLANMTVNRNPSKTGGTTINISGRDGTIDFTWYENSGQWFRNRKGMSGDILETSSSFFKWDPQPKGLEAEDLDSPDEQVSIEHGGSPQFLVGARHFHSYIEGEEPEDGQECPLSFMFAFTDCFTARRQTIGRLGPDHTYSGYTGEAMWDDGRTHSTALYFQFSNGLFANFWQAYDRMLRHSGRTIRAKVRMKCTDLMSIDMLTPVKIRGLRALPDTIEYTLSDGVYAIADMTLRAMTAQGDFDSTGEQNIPDFPPKYS